MSLLFSLGVICFAIFVASLYIMEQRFATSIIPLEPPNKVVLYKSNETVVDKSTIDILHGFFANEDAFKRAAPVTDEDLNDAIFIMEYRKGEMTLYITPGISFLFVDDSYIGNRSSLHEFIVWVHRLYDKRQGIMYTVIPHKNKELQQLLVEYK